MHIEKTENFDNQEAAQTFADKIRSQYSSPVSEVYINGPTFIDVKKVFAGIPGTENMKDYWSVSYEVYS